MEHFGNGTLKCNIQTREVEILEREKTSMSDNLSVDLGMVQSLGVTDQGRIILCWADEAGGCIVKMLSVLLFGTFLTLAVESSAMLCLLT